MLVKIDTAMGIHRNGEVAKPFLLHVKTAGHEEVEVLDEAGHASALP